MSCLGVHFALLSKDVQALQQAPDDEARRELLVEEIEPHYFAHEAGAWKAESDKAWDAMHRALSGGLLRPESGSYPLTHAVLGGQSLYGEDDYIMSLKTPAQVQDVAAALAPITCEAFRTLYDAIAAEDYDGELGDEDFDYTWGWFEDVRSLFLRAAAEGRYVLFTADQ